MPANRSARPLYEIEMRICRGIKVFQDRRLQSKFFASNGCIFKAVNDNTERKKIVKLVLYVKYNLRNFPPN
jgi:hypothetical protein